MRFRSILAPVLLAGALASVSAQAEEGSAVYRFLKAADESEPADMVPLFSKSGLSAPQFMRKIENCYLRRVYGTPEGGVMAAWMCDEGKGKSRVVIAELANVSDGVRVTIGREITNKVPAPPRTGPALSEEKNG